MHAAWRATGVRGFVRKGCVVKPVGEKEGGSVSVDRELAVREAVGRSRVEREG